MAKKTVSKAPFAFHGLDRVFHEKARLGIVSSLIGHPDGLSFSDLKSLCDLTDGNLNRHLQVLEEAGCVQLVKGREGNRPRTLCILSDEGRCKFAEYLKVLEQVVHKASAFRDDSGDLTVLQPG